MYPNTALLYRHESRQADCLSASTTNIELVQVKLADSLVHRQAGAQGQNK